MSGLPDRPDLSQLRRRAKELHRAASAGDGEGLRRVRAVSDRTTLSAAQLAVARELGFDSWPRLAGAVAAAREEVGTPLMRGKHRRAPIYGAQDFLSFARAGGWDAGPLPAGMVFTSQTFITAHLVSQADRYPRSTSLTPTNGQVFMTTSDPPVAVACLGLGAPAMVTVLEHLVGLGVRSFIAVGPAPAISTALEWGDCVVVDRALRDDGISGHYLPPARDASGDPALTASLVDEAARKGLCPTSGPAWTVPTPYRTTEEEVTAYRAEGVLVTDMVTAALFAVAAALGARAASGVIATTTLAPGPSPPARNRRGGQVVRLLEAAIEVLQAEAVTP